MFQNYRSAYSELLPFLKGTGYRAASNAKSTVGQLFRLPMRQNASSQLVFFPVSKDSTGQPVLLPVQEHLKVGLYCLQRRRI